VDWVKGDLMASLEKLINDCEMLQHTPAVDGTLLNYLLQTLPE
jgi:trimethylamine:corrinoid methyltransferase-like protein